jgi:Flp pilus assembly protein TadG
MLGLTKNEDGAAAVEMALVLPILLLLVFGIIEFGFIFNRYISVTHAAREGARQMAIRPTDELADAVAAAEASAPDLQDAGNITCSGTYPGEDVEMTCSATYSLNLFVISEDMTLTSRAKMRKE